MLFFCISGKGDSPLECNVSLLETVSSDNLSLVMQKVLILLHPFLGQRLQHSGRAQDCGAKASRSWAQFPPDAGLFSIPQKFVLIQVPQGGARPLIFFLKNRCLAEQLGAQVWQKIT